MTKDTKEGKEKINKDTEIEKNTRNRWVMKTQRKEPQKQEAGWKCVISQETECKKFMQSGVLFAQYFPDRILRLSCVLSPDLKRKATTVMMAPGMFSGKGSPKIPFCLWQ